MSFPHSNNSLMAAVKQLKEVVSRHQGEDHETVAMVREIEAIVADIERKTVNSAVSGEQQITTPGFLQQSPIPVV